MRHDTDWFKSSYSAAASNSCVEVRLWFKSSYSAAASNNCVEVQLSEAGADVRDSKNPAGPQLSVSGKGWAAFLTSLKS